MPLRVIQLTPSERKRLEAAGVIRSLRPEPEPEPEQIDIGLPVPAPNADLLRETADATRAVAEGMAMMSASQASSANAALENVSDALHRLANQKSWKKIKLRVDRDRSNNIKEAELERIE